MFFTFSICALVCFLSVLYIFKVLAAYSNGSEIMGESEASSVGDEVDLEASAPDGGSVAESNDS